MSLESQLDTIIAKLEDIDMKLGLGLGLIGGGGGGAPAPIYEWADLTGWTLSRVSVSGGVVVIPDTTSSGFHHVERTGLTIPAGSTIQFETYDAGYTIAAYTDGTSSGSLRSQVNAATGAVLTFNAGYDTTAEDIGGGVYRVTVAQPAAATSIRLRPLITQGGATYAGDGTSGVAFRNIKVFAP